MSGFRCIRISLVLMVLAANALGAGCASRTFANDPVKWSLVGGDGSWDGNSRKWTVHLTAGETKSVTIRLDNTSSQDILVLVQLGGPPDFIGLHLESPSTVLGGNGVGVRAGTGAELTVTASALGGSSPRRSTRYVVDMGWSTSGPWK
jgi:hypothetical protein